MLCSEWSWTRACCVTWRASWGQQRCPLPLCTWGLTRRGVWSKEIVGKSRVGLYAGIDCPESLLRQWPQRTVCSTQWGLPCVCVVGAQERDVLTLSIKECVFSFHDRTVKTHGWRSPKEENAGVRDGSFSGRVIFSVDSHTAFLKCPSLDLLIVSDSEVSCLTPVHAHSPRSFPQGLLSPLRSCLPMTWWPGPCEEAPLGTVLGRASHPWVGDGVLCCWAAGVA